MTFTTFLIHAQANEPQYTRNRVREFLRGHSCYELIPESGKVVLLDTGLPIRQAFHALHEQVTPAVFANFQSQMPGD